MIDTLKMAKVLERAGLQRDGAEELREQIDRRYVTRDHFDARLDALYWKMMAGVTTLLFGHFIAVWFYVGGRLNAIEAAVAKIGG